MKEIYLVANGDLRLSANQACWPAQASMEKLLIAQVEREGSKIVRAHPFDARLGHGFIDSQKMGVEVFRSIPREAPLIVAEAVWQYSQNLVPGLYAHRGPILTVANWSGQHPGLVGLLNLNATLTKLGCAYSTLWSQDFDDDFFLEGLRSWLGDGSVKHDTSHAVPYTTIHKDAFQRQTVLGNQFADEFLRQPHIMGVFDEGCMGMHNAIIPDEILAPMGIFKERLSQSALYAEMLTVTDEEARAVYDWCVRKGIRFVFGPNTETDLTEVQVLTQCKMYVAAVRMADTFGCATIGIQYQQGLKDLCPASDLVEGLLNNVERPPVYHKTSGAELFPGEAVPHFNEVDECAGVDGLVTYWLWRRLGLPPETTLHDLRWAEQYVGEGIDAYVWVLLISGAAPAAHFVDGYRGASSERQPPMYFRLGGGTLKGVSKPGWVVWSRVFVKEGRLKFDTGLAETVALPKAETERRWQLTTPMWPVMHAVFQGISRDQMMACHQSNHIQVAYGRDRQSACEALFAKAAVMFQLGMDVRICGDVSVG